MERPVDTHHLDLGRPDAYGRSFADVYDRWYHDVSDAEATAAFVATRCRGPVLELGVGSGRLARPLAALGLPVIGLDGSGDMLTRCSAQSMDGISLVIADMRSLPFLGGFGAVLIAFNTIFNLTSEEEQQHLLTELKALVGETGVVIVEASDVTPLLAGPRRSIGLRELTDNGAVVTATTLDHEHQTVSGHHLEVTDDGITARPWRLRWLTPAQLDNLATAAGLRRVERYRSWDQAPFFEGDETYISVYSGGPT